MLMYPHKHTHAYMHFDQHNTRISVPKYCCCCKCSLCVLFFVVREKFGTLSVIKCWTCFCEFIINENKYNNYAYVCVWIINTLKHTYIHTYMHTNVHKIIGCCYCFFLWFRYDDFDGDWHSEIETGIIGIEMYIILFIRTISLFQVLPKVLVSALRYICMRLCLYVCM